MPLPHVLLMFAAALALLVLGHLNPSHVLNEMG